MPEIFNVEQVQKLLQFYIDNAMGLAMQTNVEVDAELKIRIIPNTDKNIDAKFVVAGSGKIVIPGRDEVLHLLKDEEEKKE